MRRRRLFFAACGLTALAASLTAACGAEDAAPSGTRIDADASASIRGPAAPVPPAAGQRRIAVVYFSEPETEDRRAVQGSTEFIASVIGKATGGALYRIERSAPYPSSHEALTAEANEERDRGARPAIQGPGNLSEVDTVFLGYPIWWYDMPMPVYSFLEAYDLSGKTIIPFVTHGGSGLTGTADRIAAAALLSLPAAAMRPVLLEDQGSFFAGGTVRTAEGVYRGNEDARDLSGETLHGDHAYVFWQRPAHARTMALVFLHGAGRSTVPETISAVPDDQLWYNNFRIGVWPETLPGAAAADDAAWRDQFFRQMTPNTGAHDEDVISRAMAAVFERSGPGVLVSHSQGGGPGWRTAILSDKVRGVIAIEPGTFPFPEGEVPPVEETSSPFPAAGTAVPMADFLRLTKIPVLVIFGDNIPEEPTDVWGLDNWRVRLRLARRWAETVNRHGGDAAVLSLPDAGLYGNTHFLMSDRNNREVADLMERWMETHHLDGKKA